MRRLVPVLAILIAPLMTLEPAGAQQGVWVRARETGQGILRGRGSDCFAIVPDHVVMGSQQSPPPTIRIVGVYGIEASASHETSFAGDLAVLELEVGDLRCAAWSAPSAASAVGAEGAYLRIVDESGAERAIPVEVTAGMLDYLSVRPKNAGHEIVQGMSGASLMLSGTPVGMLLSVCQNPDECTPGEGDVVRLDALARLTDGFFRPPDASVESTQALEIARYQAEAAARYDSMMLARRNGRPPDLPTLKRDVSGLTLIPYWGSLQCLAVPENHTSLGGCEMEVDGLQRITEMGGLQGIRHLYVTLSLSHGILFDAPPLPEVVASCELRAEDGTIREVVVRRWGEPDDTEGVPEASTSVGLAWGDTGEALPAGEYWTVCEVDGQEYESNHLALGSPSLPWGRLEMWPPRGGESGRGTIPAIELKLGDQSETWSVAEDPLSRIRFQRPRRLDQPLSVSFDIVTDPGSPVVSPERAAGQLLACSGSRLRQESLEVTERAPGTWRVEVTFRPNGDRWGGASLGFCTIGQVRLFEFVVEVG